MTATSIFLALEHQTLRVDFESNLEIQIILTAHHNTIEMLILCYRAQQCTCQIKKPAFKKQAF